MVKFCFMCAVYPGRKPIPVICVQVFVSLLIAVFVACGVVKVWRAYFIGDVSFSITEQSI